ncbi:MAG: hypothetical protein WCZ20_14875, partial [Hydrogenophaga sp.]
MGSSHSDAEVFFGPWLKGWPIGQPPLTREQLGRAGWNVLRGNLPLPLAVLRQPALRHNLYWMRDFCAQ